MNSRRSSFALFLIIWVAVIVAGCAKEQPRLVQEGPITAATIVATVDTAKITLGEVLDEYVQNTAPGSHAAPTLENAVNETIYRKCAYLLADSYRDFDKDEVYREARNRAHDALINYMLTDLFAKQLEISDASVDSAYKANIAQYSIPERRDVTQLLVSDNPKAWEAAGVDVTKLTEAELDAKAKAQCEEYYKEIKNGASLGDLAFKYSHDTNSKPNHGRTGFFQRGQMVEPFEKWTFKLPIGGMSPPFRTTYGWHILRVDSVKDSTVTPLDSTLRGSIRMQLKNAKQAKVVTAYVDSVDSAATLTWNEPLLEKNVGDYNPLDWACIVNGTDTIAAGILRELELVYRTGGRLGTVTPEVRKQILMSKVSPFALVSAARDLGYLDRDTMKQVFRNIYRQEVVGRIYRVRTSTPDKQPSDAELKAYYEEHKSDFISDKPIKLEQIILPDSVQAADVKRQAEAGADFAQLAAKYNPGKPNSKDEAFDLGWVSSEDVAPEIFNPAWIMNVGDIAGPVQTRWGWHLIKIVDRKSMKTFEAARLDLQQMMRSEALKETNDNWVRMVTKGRDIVKYEDILSQVDPSKQDRYVQLADSLARAKATADTASSGS